MSYLMKPDYLNPQSTQPALRNFIEEFSANCGFILTCNFPNRIIEPLHSRCSVVEFKMTASNKLELGKEFFKRVREILSLENIEADQQVLGCNNSSTLSRLEKSLKRTAEIFI